MRIKHRCVTLEQIKNGGMMWCDIQLLLVIKKKKKKVEKRNIRKVEKSQVMSIPRKKKGKKHKKCGNNA